MFSTRALASQGVVRDHSLPEMVHSADERIGSASRLTAKSNTDLDQLNDCEIPMQMSAAKYLTRDLLSSKWFQLLILLCIISTSVFAGVETYVGMRESVVIRILDLVVLIIFGIEVILRLVCKCPTVWNFWIGESWLSNWFDFLVVSVGIISGLDQDGKSSSVLLLPKAYQTCEQNTADAANSFWSCQRDEVCW